jgi:TP901 family phage tail tape measure protein
MPGLEPLVQVFAVNAVRFLAGVDEMVAAAKELTAAINQAQMASARLTGVADAAGAADARAAAGADEAAAGYDRMAVAAKTAGDSAAVAGDKAEVSGGKAAAFGTGMKTALLGVGLAAVYGVTQAAKFQSSMTTLLTQAGVARSQFAGLEQGVLALAGQVGFSPTSLASALYHVESSFQSVGITGPKALNLLKIAAEGAATGHANLVDVTNALDATIAAGVGGIKNYSQAMGALNAIVGAGDMTMQDLADAMGTGLMAQGKLYGQSLQQIGGALATLGDNNIRGAKAATDLRMSWQAIQAPMKAGIPVLQALSLQSGTLAYTMTHKGLTAALQQFVDHLRASKVPVQDWGQIITDVFGKRAGTGIGVLIDQLDRLKSKLPDVQKGADSFGQAWVTQGKTIGQQWHDLLAGLQSLAISFGQLLLPPATKVVGVLAKFATFVQRHADLAAFAGGLLALAAAFKVASVAMDAFGKGGSLAMLASPAFLAVAAIAALAFGLYELYRHSQLVRAVVADVARFFRTVWADTMHVAGAVIQWFVHGPLAFIKQQIGVFSQWWASHGKEVEQVTSAVWHAVYAIISAYWKLTYTELKAGLKLLEIAWTTTWTVVKDLVRYVWDAMANIIRVNLRLILDVIGVILDLITGHWGKAWNDLKKLASDALHGTITLIKSVVGGFGMLLYDAGRAVVMGLIHGIESMFGSLGGVMSGVGHLIKSFLPFSPAKQGPLSGSGDPANSGRSIARNLALGITDGRGLVHGAMTGLLSGGLAGGAGGLAVGGGGGYGGGNTTVNVNVNGFVGNNQELAHAIYLVVQQESLRSNKRNPTNGLALRFGLG